MNPTPTLCSSTPTAARRARWPSRLAPALAALVLAACGGSDGPAGPDARATASAVREAPMAGEPAAPTVDAALLMDWAEVKFAALFRGQTATLSRSGPDGFPLSFQGQDYTVRAYPGNRFLGVTAGGRVYGLGDYTNNALADFGPIGNWAALVLAEAQPQTVSVMLVSDVGAGEQFRFVLGSTPAVVTRTGEAVAFGTLPGGSVYSVVQTDGPRTCTASANRSGTIGFRPVVVTMDCGRPPGRSLLAGQLHAPVGAVVTLQVNGGSDLTLTMPPFAGSSDPYNLLPFAFADALPDGAAYQVTVKTAPPGQLCSVYKGASSTMPVALGGLRVGCEWRDDRVSRSTDNQFRGSYFNSRDLVIGGAAAPVGNTRDGYGEGRFVAFVSLAAGLGGSTGARRQVFWRDRLTGETLLISANAAGQHGNGDSFAPAISADGLTVAFESHATNLADNDTNGVRDIFVWSAMNRERGAVRVNLGPGGVQANSESFEPTISGDGRRVAFTTSASNLTPGVANNDTVNVVLRDLPGATNVLVSARPDGVGAGGSRPSISEDGKRIAFYSFSPQLVGGDTNGLWDIFVYDADTLAIKRVSFNASGGEREQGSESASRVVSPTISGNGRFVAFSTTARNMAPGDNNVFQDVFVADVQTGAVTHLSAGVAGVAGNGDSPVGQGERIALSYDGSWVAYTTGASNLGVQLGQVVMRHRLTGETRPIGPPGGSSAHVAISRDAAFVAFGHDATVDARWPGSGLFVELTGVGRSWWWFD